jgi:FtsZ-interacting cell division protein YlmF
LAKDFFHKYKNIINKDDYNDQEYEDKDNFGSVETDESKKISKSERKRLEKIKTMKKTQETKSKRATERLLNSCSMCIANNRLWEEQIICCGTSTMLMLPRQSKNSL